MIPVLDVGIDDIVVGDEVLVELVVGEAVDKLTGEVEPVDVIVDSEVELGPVAEVDVDTGNLVPAVAEEAVGLLLN